MHLGFKPLKYSEDKLPRTAFRIQYKMRLFFFFKIYTITGYFCNATWTHPLELFRGVQTNASAENIKEASEKLQEWGGYWSFQIK